MLVQMSHSTCRYAELGWFRDKALPVVAVANVAGNYSLPDLTRLSEGVPRKFDVPDVAGDAWFSLAVGAGGAPHDHDVPHRD